MNTHMASDESLIKIFNAVSGSALSAAGDGRTAVLATGNVDAIDGFYNMMAKKATTQKEMNALFIDWWTANWDPTLSTYNGMLERWFGTVLNDNRVHGVKFPLFSTSNTAIGELTDDSVGLACSPSTATTASVDDFAALPQFWCVEVAAEKNADGSHTIYACQYIDDDDVVRGSNHLVWVLQKNTFTRERNENGYRIFKMRCNPSAGYEQWPQGTDRTGKVYPYIANPKYFAGMQDDGKIGGHTGLAPVNYTSHTKGVQLWRQRGPQYAGASGRTLKWQLRMIWLKYARKGNSGTIEGCTSYNYQYRAAFSAESVNYFPLTAAQAANLLVGSWVAIGSHNKDTTDRNDASLHDILTEAQITRIEDIAVDDVTYKAVYVDSGDATWDVVKDQSMISTMPYGSGYNDTVLGNDGSRTNYTNGKEPGLIQKTEFQNGAYLIVADELWKWDKDGDGNYTFDVYTCHDQTKITTDGTISADYTKCEDLTLRFADGTPNAWQCIEDTAISGDPAVLWPAAVSNRAGTGTGVKAGFCVNPAASGVRAPWRCCNLNNGGNASLAAANSNNWVGNANWNGGVGVQLVQKIIIHCIIHSALMCENFLKPASRRCVRRKGRVHPWRQDKEPAGG